eukprot:COSAG05_NODE_1810_length_4040_cov_11.771885_3_plen_130_part_00
MPLVPGLAAESTESLALQALWLHDTRLQRQRWRRQARENTAISQLLDLGITSGISIHGRGDNLRSGGRGSVLLAGARGRWSLLVRAVLKKQVRHPHHHLVEKQKQGGKGRQTCIDRQGGRRWGRERESY